MAARKRASTQAKLLKRAVKAGRSALLEAQRRVPPDLRKQIERAVRDGQKTMHTAIKQVQVRVDRTARQADLDRAMKRLEALSKQVRTMAAAAAASTTTSRPARKPATRKAATRKTPARKPAPRATPKPTSARRSTRTKTRSQAAPPPPPERSDMGGPG